MHSRRSFVCGMIAAIATAAYATSPFGRPRNTTRAATELPEEYGGFLIAPPGFLAPIHGHRRSPQWESLDGKAIAPLDQRSFSTAEEAAEDAGIGLYVLRGPGFRDLGSTVVREVTGKVFSVSGAAEVRSNRNGGSQLVGLYVEPYVGQPVTIHKSSTLENRLILEKLPFLPRPGVGIRATSEFVAHWLEGDVRYTLICQGITSSDDLRELTRSLAKVG